MANNIVQLKDYNDNNIYPIAGAAAQGSITKSMLDEGVFEGPELSEPSTVAYVATDNIQDGAVTSDKIDWTASTAMDFTSSVTFNEGATTQYTEFLVKQNTVWIDYQGYNKTHSIGETLFTLPEAYRPTVRKHVSGSFGGTNPALFIIGTDGTCVINQATSSGLSGTHRAYLQVSYPLP